MAVWTEDSKIFNAIIVPVTIDVIKLKGDSTIYRRFIPAAHAALFCQYVFGKKTSFELMTLKRAVFFQDILEWCFWQKDVVLAFVPSFAGKMGGVALESPYCLSDLLVVSTSRNKPDCDNYSADACCCAYCNEHILVCPSSAWH